MIGNLASLSARYFVEVANSGSVALAAERLHVAGSAISRQIKMLEGNLGVVLFERKARGMHLSAAGRVLADHIRRAGLEEGRVLDLIKNSPRVLEAEIVVSAIAGLAASFVPDTIAAFQRFHPRVRFRTFVKTREQIINDVRQGVSDIGIAFGSGPSDNIEVVERVVAGACAIVAANHPLAKRKFLDLKAISKFPIATSPQSCIRQLIDIRASAEGLALDVRFESDNTASLFRYVSQTRTVSFAVRLSVREWLQRGVLVAIPLLDQKAFERSIEFKVMAGRVMPDAVACFIDFASSELKAGTI